MNNNDFLLNKLVTIYLDGGWELSGVILNIDKDKMIIDNDQGNFLLFRDKVCCILTDKKQEEKPFSGDRTPLGVIRGKDVNNSEGVVENSAYNDAGMHIPLDMLSEDSRKEFKEEPNLSVRFSPARGDKEGASDGNIVFRLEDDSEK